MRKAGTPAGPIWVSVLLTFLTSCLIGAMFRAPTLESAGHVYGALVGLNATWDVSLLGPRAITMLPLCVLAAWGLPNSAQFFRHIWTALDPRPEPTPTPVHRLGVFQLSRAWAVVTAAVLVICLCLISEARRFVYVQF